MAYRTAEGSGYDLIGPIWWEQLAQGLGREPRDETLSQALDPDLEAGR